MGGEPHLGRDKRGSPPYARIFLNCQDTRLGYYPESPATSIVIFTKAGQHLRIFPGPDRTNWSFAGTFSGSQSLLQFVCIDMEEPAVQAVRQADGIAEIIEQIFPDFFGFDLPDLIEFFI